jgi:nitrogen-specific signal transduction histidine kinase
MDKDDVPRGSIIINEPLWEKYQPLFLLFYSALVVILVLAIIALFRANRREFKRRYYAQTRLLLQGKMVDQRNEFDNVFHSIHEGVIIYGADFKIHFVNKAAAGMVSVEFDRERNQYENLPAGSFLKIYHKGDEVLYKLLEEVKRTGASVSIQRFVYAGTENKRLFFCLGRGDSALLQIKVERLCPFIQKHCCRRGKKRFFNLAVEESSIYPWQFNISDGVYTFPKGFIERMGFNSTSGRLSRSELRRKIHPDDLPGIKIEFDALLAGDKNNSRIAFRQKNKKGQYEWWEYRMMVLNGLIPHSPSSILGVCQSIQRHKDVEAELIAARDKAMQSDRLKTAFLANMSHEIRTPLNSIVGFSGLLKEIHSFSEEEVAQFVDTINQNCELLLSLISDILDMSRIESGAMDFQIAECNLSLLVDEVYHSQKINVPPAVSLLKNVPLHEEKQILADPVRLKQILNNLINNASKFTKEGSITVGYHLNERGLLRSLWKIRYWHLRR